MSRLKLSPWFYSNPKRVGIYQGVGYYTKFLYHYWDGDIWYFGATTKELAVSNYEQRKKSFGVLRWRGVLKLN